MKEKSKLIVTSFSLIGLIIISVSLSNLLIGIGHYFFYQIVYCVFISVCIPIYFYRNEDHRDLSMLGIKSLRNIDYVVIIGFVVFLIGGQLMNVKLSNINFKLLPLSIIPLIMTTFSEEFLFRGFLQIRLEKAFGAIPAIVLSGLAFSIYHLGYPGFRSINLITLLFFVGIMFALSFKLSNNNLIVAYIVNLPNACLTYLLKTDNFPKSNFTMQSSIVTIFVILLTIFIVKKELLNGSKNE